MVNSLRILTSGYIPAAGQFFTETAYDTLGRVNVITQPDGAASVTNYNIHLLNGLASPVTYTEDANGNISEAWTDAFGRLLKSQGTIGPAVTYTYDPADRLTSALYGSAQTQISYDIAGRKLTLDDPDMGLWTYAYDALSNLTRQTDARGQRICLYYDPLNRLLGKHYRADDNCPTSPTYNVSYGYDAGTYGKLQRTSMTDASGSTAWTYTARGLLETETKAITGAGTFATKYTYNSADLPTNMQYPADNAGGLTALPSLTYTYLPQMALDTLGSYVTGTLYDAAGRITNRSLGNGTSITNTFTAWNTPLQGGRLSNITAVQSGTTRQNLSYTYDAVGNITQIADALGLTTNYTYDGLNRLDLTTESSNNNPEYDPTTGNLLYMDGNEQIPTLYGYNDPEHVHAVTQKGGGSQQYYYDANGNMIQRPNRTLQYNAENQLTSVSGTPSATFVYDGDGNRVKTTVGTTTTAYIGNHTEWNVTAQEMTRYYLAGGQRVAFRVIKSGQADKVFYLLADHLGSTNVVMQVGGVVENKTYTAWGKDRTGSITNTDRQYTGQINESELGLYFYNARYYDPSLGRFISADTIIPQPGNPSSHDRYSYVNNNPINNIDPTGHRACSGWDEYGNCILDPERNIRLHNKGLKYKNIETLHSQFFLSSWPPTSGEHPFIIQQSENLSRFENIPYDNYDPSEPIIYGPSVIPYYLSEVVSEFTRYFKRQEPLSDKDYSFAVYITGNVDIDTFGKIPERKYIQEIQYDLHGAYINNTTKMALIFVTSVSGEINGARTVEPGGKDGIFINTSCKVCSILITVRSINSEYLKIIYFNVP